MVVVDVEDRNFSGAFIEQVLRGYRCVIQVAVTADVVGRSMMAWWPTQLEDAVLARPEVRCAGERNIGRSFRGLPGAAHYRAATVEGV